MAKPFNQLLAVSLKQAKQVAWHQIIRSEQISRICRERLIKGGCLQKIISGWYLLCSPNAESGESTLWYANFWDFAKLYLQVQFKNGYCLSAEASLDLFLGKNYLPSQVVVMVKSGGSFSLILPHNTSLLIYQETKNFPKDIVSYNGLNVLSFEYALCKMPPAFYRQNPEDAEIALRMLNSSEKILPFLLGNGMIQAASRIIGGLRHLTRNTIADEILQAMESAGFVINEINPFLEKPFLSERTIIKSPYCARIEFLWVKNRSAIVKMFPKPAASSKEIKIQIKNIDSIYTLDAYHSLSIEGYKVTEELIERIARGLWQPEDNPEDFQQQNAMAAKGYYEAFKEVKKTINDMMKAQYPIKILQRDFPKWYLKLFSGAVTAGIIPAVQLAGFRNHPVYIRSSMHVPPPHSAVRDSMETLFNCIADEENAAVRAILSHWLIGFIHPYADGNGRMARFIMNALFISGGYPWMVINVTHRKIYLDALEQASSHGDIKPFCKLIIREMQRKLGKLGVKP